MIDKHVKKLGCWAYLFPGKEVSKLVTLISDDRSPRGVSTDDPLLNRLLIEEKKSKNIEQHSYDAFICFNTIDDQYATEVFKKLNSLGQKVFFSKKTIEETGDSSFVTMIHKALESTTNMVVVTSSAKNIDTRWVRYEWETFINDKNNGKKDGNIITVLCGDLKAHELPVGLSRWQTIKFASELDRLGRYIGGLK